MTKSFSSTLAALSLLGFASLATPVHAIEPMPQEHIDALKANCKWDYMSNCMSVSVNGPGAFQCLRRNVNNLSPACQSAVRAVPPPKKG